MLGITDIPDEMLDIMRKTQAPISQKKNLKQQKKQKSCTGRYVVDTLRH